MRLLATPPPAPTRLDEVCSRLDRWDWARSEDSLDFIDVGTFDEKPAAKTKAPRASTVPVS